MRSFESDDGEGRTRQDERGSRYRGEGGGAARSQLLIHHHHHQQQQQLAADQPIPCPRCQSMNTKFCYYNNYSVNQPRHFCRNCQRYWTVGGTLRNVPVGGGTRKKVHRTRQRSMSSSDGLQPLLQQQSGSVTEFPPNTTTTTSPHLPTFLHYLSNLDHQRERQNIHGSFNAGSSLSKNLLAASTTPATSTAGLMMNLQQDHVMVSTSLHSSATSSMYEHQSSTSTMPMNSRGLQLAGGASNIVQAAPGSLFSN
ncbi:unnamed protein product, partial [Sphagnum jensenii]